MFVQGGAENVSCGRKLQYARTVVDQPFYYEIFNDLFDVVKLHACSVGLTTDELAILVLSYIPVHSKLRMSLTMSA